MGQTSTQLSSIVSVSVPALREFLTGLPLEKNVSQNKVMSPLLAFAMLFLIATENKHSC